MRIPIVFATDHNFVMPTSVTITSLLLSKLPETIFDINVIIDENVTDEDKKKLTKQVKELSEDSSISFIEIGSLFDKGYEIRDISKACYNRLMIPWLLNYDKVIYSDVDIIFTGDISEVYKIELNEELVAGVSGKVWKKGIVKKYLLKIGANPEEYVNSGFLLLNSKKQRELNLKSSYLSLVEKKFIYQDQDIINLVCKGRIKHLPEVYNIKPIDYPDYSPQEAKVIHYIGIKPWNYFTYSWREWWNVYEKSVFYDRNFNKNISDKILNHSYKREVKKKVLTNKVKFLYNYLFR